MQWIQERLSDLYLQLPSKPQHIRFYGAGCSSEAARKKITLAFNIQFPNIALELHTDLLAAARALCNGQPGMVCLLGTGSHAARCDGHEIIHQLPSLGYLLGDEGGGCDLGKLLLQAYFLNQMDEDLKSILEHAHPEIKQDFIFQLYQSSRPSALLAGFARFMVENQDHPHIRSMIFRSFGAFVQARLRDYKAFSSLPVHVCGSIGFHLKATLERVLEEQGFRLGKVLQKPLHELILYHQQHEHH
ncbi:MAG TPA: hypothetical protein VFX48_05035 [Saprospiraceae bacterium]|nr:hypothetical protein [Saprospiraceae bacterium]